MAQKFLVAVDRGCVRIYRFSQQPGQLTPSIQPVEAIDLPRSGLHHPVETHPPGRFRAPVSRGGGRIDQEYPLIQDEATRQIIEKLVEQIGGFLERHPHSTWDLAAGSALREALIESLPDSVRLRLDKVVSKDLVNVPPAEIREHFIAR